MPQPSWRVLSPASVAAQALPEPLRRWREFPSASGHEKVILIFFLGIALAGQFRPLALNQRLNLMLVPILLAALRVAEVYLGRPWSRVGREWASLSLILPAYWSQEYFYHGHSAILQNLWVGWDRTLLYQFGFKAIVEACGSAIPAALETTYLLLYTIPPICLGLIQYFGTRADRNRFLRIFFLGTFTTYAILPLFAVESPRIVFPGADLPAFAGFARQINVWLLDHMDITTSVFPSGHVAVAFSCAFGMLAALPRRKPFWLAAFAVATTVFAATIYGRYHYAVDGTASIAIATAAWLAARFMDYRADLDAASTVATTDMPGNNGRA